MATVFAKQNGNWTDTTLWAFWNESTQQIEDYGQAPQENDVVYANSFLVDNIPDGLTVKELRNDTNPYTAFLNGSFRAYATTYQTRTVNINADLYSGEETTQVLLTRHLQNGTNGSVNYIINGNIINNSNVFCISVGGYTSGGTANITINGNCFGKIAELRAYINSNNSYIHINGNVESNKTIFHLNETNLLYGGGILINGNLLYNIDSPDSPIVDNNPQNGNGFQNLSINGNVETKTGLFNHTFTISGDYVYKSRTLTNYTIFKTSGNIYYTDGYWGVNCLVEYIGDDPDDFEWLYIGSLPNPNPYIIINPNTIAQTYPLETQVLKDVVYGAQNQLVGTYQADYPSESVVLHNIVYADGDIVGTLEPVSNTNIINIIKR